MQVKNIFTGFQFVPKKVKKKQYDKRYTRLVNALCIAKGNKLFAEINTTKGKQELEFTSNSYNLKNRLIVFSKKKDKYNKPIMIYRNEITAKHSPGLRTQYTTLYPNYVYNGYLVKKNDKWYFDMYEIIGPKSVNFSILNEKVNLNDK